MRSRLVGPGTTSESFPLAGLHGRRQLEPPHHDETNNRGKEIEISEVAAARDAVYSVCDACKRICSYLLWFKSSWSSDPETCRRVVRTGKIHGNGQIFKHNNYFIANLDACTAFDI